MANFTPNVNLEKPLGSEHYLIPKFNANMDKIDTKFGELQNLGGIISEAIAKATPVDADTVALSDSAETGALKKLSWLNIKETLKTYFDGLYATIANLNLKAPLANPTFTGTQTLPNIVTNGIKFPATQVPSADPNTLDDYEEGTFTPTLIGLTTEGTGNVYAVQTGQYVKVGNLVTVYGRIALSTKGNATGLALIGGLPFPLKSITARVKGHLSQVANITGVTLDNLHGTYLFNKGGAGCFVLDNKDGSGVDFTSITNGTILDFLATYSAN